ncbi:MAG: RHS repeat-associated core domain-containing protein [Flavobacteriales bacterium]
MFLEQNISIGYLEFGSLLPGRNASSGDYRYGFGGHEKDDEVKGSGNSYDMGARLYDPRIGRTPTRDPYEAVYPGISPYVYALNSPIQAVDPDGNLVIFVNGYHNGASGIFGGVFGNGILTEIGRKKYWGGLDVKFSERIKDDNTYYSDGGARSAYSSATERYNQGVEEGKAMLKMIDEGDIKIEVDENGKPTETIKIVSHSQGSAKAAGISNVLTEAGYKVEVEYNIAPKQGEDIPETKADRKVQFGSDADFIAPQSPIKDAEQYELSKEEKTVSSGGGHKVGSYDEVLDIEKGSDGYVAPRKDSPAPTPKN